MGQLESKNDYPSKAKGNIMFHRSVLVESPFAPCERHCSRCLHLRQGGSRPLRRTTGTFRPSTQKLNLFKRTSSQLCKLRFLAEKSDFHSLPRCRLRVLDSTCT